MTMPDTIALPRAPAVAEAAAAPRNAAAPAAASGDGFAQTLADVIGPETSGAAAEKGVAVAPEAEAEVDAAAPVIAKAAVVLDDMGRIAALLPVAAPAVEGAADAPATDGTDIPPAAAVQAALAGAVLKALVSPEDAGDETLGEEGAKAEAEDVDPMAALGLGPAAQATAAPLPIDGEAETAVGQAVAVAVAQGAMQPMMAAQAKPASGPAVPLAETKLDGEQSLETEGVDGAAEVAEAVQRREAAGLTPVAAPPVDRSVARTGGEPVVNPLVDTLAAATAPTGQAAPQAAQVTAQAPVVAGFSAPAPIATDRAGWEGALADRIAAELSGDGQQMDLELAPEHLGRLKIRLEMTDGLAQVRFVTETPEAARVIQQNEHRLSDALSRAGLSLGGQETTSRDPQGDRPARGEGPATRFLERPVDVQTAPLPGRAGRGLVNLIA